MKGTLNRLALGSLSLVVLVSACSPQAEPKNMRIDGPESLEGEYYRSFSYYLTPNEQSPALLEELKKQNCLKIEEPRLLVYKCPGNLSFVEETR